MEAGRLRHRVTIQSKSVSRNTFGEEEITWEDVATVWGSVEPLRGREFMEGRQIQAEITHRIRVRYYPDGIEPEYRVVYDSRYFDVMAVIEVEERHREMHLMCREIDDWEHGGNAPEGD